MAAGPTPGRASFFFQAEDGIRDHCVTGVQTCALPICWVDRLATRLGVSAATLRSALQDVRDATPTADRHADLVSALALGLGRSPTQVRAALDGGRTQRPRGRDGLADALARELGLDAAKVRAAVDEVQDA